VQVHELGIDRDELFLVMEYLEGESVSGLMRRLAHRRERLDYALGAYVVAEACAGLHAAHEYSDDFGIAQNLVHRDVSPQNIFVTYDGSVKVLDFGIAKAADRYSNTSTGQMKGKFSYMAPEQCRAEELDRRADLFALGIVLYEMTTAKRLFMRENQLLVLKAITEEAVPPPSQIRSDYPPHVEHAVMMALARNRDERYSTAAEMRRELLAAVRALDPTGMPEERLGDLMKKVFADRIGEKAEMLRQVRAGTVQISVPAAEVDSETGEARAPRLSAPVRELSSPGTLASQEAEVAPRAGRAKRKSLVLALGVAVAAVALAAVLVSGGDQDAEERAHALAQLPAQAPESPSATAGETQVSNVTSGDPDGTRAAAAPGRPGGIAESPLEPAPEPEPVPATVTVRLVTIPPGATVNLAGDPSGTTPVELELDRGDQALGLTLSLQGYETHEDQIVPDVDQRLRLTLRREPVPRRVRFRRPTGTAMASTAAPPSMEPAPQPTMMQESFFRFD
jgi:serine/threonine-protein kinase